MKIAETIQLMTQGTTAASCVLALNSAAFGAGISYLGNPKNETTSVAVPFFIGESTMVAAGYGFQIATSAKTASTDVLAEKFYSLATQWKRETGRFSIIAMRYDNPAYKAILDMRELAIPLILNELKRNPDRWFAALEKLTGENPAKDAVNFYEAVDRWVAWGIANEYIA